MKGKLTFIERVANFFGFKRFYPYLYDGASVTRLTGDWISTLLSSDQEIRGNIRMLRARARDLARNNPIAKNYLNLLAANVIGDNGIRYQSKVRNNSGELNKQINTKIEQAWRDFGKVGECTADGKLSMRALEDLIIRTVAQDGECFVRLLPGFKNKFRFAMQLIDADQVDPLFNRFASETENEVRMGVEVDQWGKPVAYWVNPKPPSEYGGSLNRERIPAEQIVHLYDPSRVNQTRGVTWFHAVMAQLKMLGGYIEAELVAARTGAAKMGWLRYTDPSAYETPNADAQKAGYYTLEANPGMIETLPPGMEFVAWNPDHPANAFPNFVIALLRQVASGLGVSYNALASDLVGVNYSSLRSGLLIERELWRRLQAWLIEAFLLRIFEQWLDMALLSGTLVLDSRDPAKFLTGVWIPRGWAWVDPLKDVQASSIAIANGLTSRFQVLAEKGEDFEETVEQLADENKIAEQYDVDISGVAAAPKINKATDEEAPPPAADEADAGKESTAQDAARLLEFRKGRA
jgi:lambda family phage portal protein